MDVKALYYSLSDTVIITDAYGYVMEFNKKDALPEIKRGKKLSVWIPDYISETEQEIVLNNKTCLRRTTPLYRGETVAGYIVFLVDISEKVRLREESKKTEKRLQELINSQLEANERLSEYVMQVKELSDYSEQLRIARSIHDDSGHAITAVHTISGMCISLKNKDIDAYRELIAEGIDICENALAQENKKEYKTIYELLEHFCRVSAFPVETRILGEEPQFIKRLYDVIERMCQEAYHNTLEHSLADRLDICIDMQADGVRVTITDNGVFKGELEKGFGLMAMEDYILASGGSLKIIAEQGKGFGIEAYWREDNEGKD